MESKKSVIKEVLSLKNFIRILVAGSLLIAGSALADEASTNVRMNQLEERLEKLEKKSSESFMDKVKISGIIAGAYQYQSANADNDDFGRGGIVFQPEVSICPTEADEVFFKFGFGAGNGLNVDKYAFNLTPWASDYEDDVKDINGRNRDYLLTVWWKHVFSLGERHTLGISGGIIDSTDYLDENNYANDQNTQFMNEAFVNSPIAFLPSYDIGGALEWEVGAFSAKGVIMGVGENDDGNAYSFYGMQLAYSVDSSMGQGTYRIIFDGTSKDFAKPGGGKASLKGVTISCDQEIGRLLGVWVRFSWQDDKPTVDYDYMYSGGVNISGALWGREQDNAGLGYAYLGGGNADIDNSQVMEGYVRFGLWDFCALTFDAQYLDDKYKGASDHEDVKGWVTGVRVTVEF